jgi:hypothetical protein
MHAYTVPRTIGAVAIMGLATQTVAAPQPADLAAPNTAALDERITFNDVEQFTKSFFTSFFKRDLEVAAPSTQPSTQSSTQSSTGVMNNGLSHLNHTLALVKSSGLTNSSAALLASSLNHMKTTISSKLNPEEKAAFVAAAKNFSIPVPAHSKRDASKEGTIAGDAASFFQHAWSLLKGASGLLEGAAESVKKRDAAKDGTIAGDAASFFQHVASIFGGLFESVE